MERASRVLLLIALQQSWGVMRINRRPVEIPVLAAALNEASARYEIAGLQQLRADLRSKTRLASRRIFDRRTIHPTYAFHLGGRTELQFNIGTEERGGQPAIRHGVAFSLELSQSLPSIDPLLPKIARFNDFVRSQPEDFPGLRMWHHDGVGRHPDHGVGPIDDDVAQAGSFIMLGRWVRESEVSVDEILLDFDRLLPLFAYVESGGTRPGHRPVPGFHPGCPAFVTKASVVRPERVTDVALRHKLLQPLLHKCLSSEAGASNVQTEHHLDLGVRVDAAVRLRRGFAFYELKVAPTFQACMRAAIGQLLEYAHWPSAVRASELIIVGEFPADKDARAYLRLLRNKFSLPVWYRHLSVSPLCLGPKV